MANLLMTKSEGVVTGVYRIDRDLVEVTVFDENRQIPVQAICETKEHTFAIGDKVDVGFEIIGLTANGYSGMMQFNFTPKNEVKYVRN